MNNTENKAIIVTGASSGTSAAVAKRMAGEGAVVALAARREDKIAGGAGGGGGDPGRRGAAAAGLVVVAALFGRFFCAVLCPLGTVQDVIGACRPRQRTRIPDFRLCCYAIAVLTVILLAGGWTIVLLYLDPFSRFGALVAAAPGDAGFTASGTLWSGVVQPVVLAVLVLWKKRIYCVSLCPVGTVLGLLSRNAAYGTRIDSGCVMCGAFLPSK